MEINLTDFQANLLLDVITKRQKAVEAENEALRMVFATHQVDPPQSPISINGNKLSWESKTEE